MSLLRCLTTISNLRFNKILLKSMYVQCVLVAQSCLSLCDPMDCILPGSPVHGVLQARSPLFLQGIFPAQGLNPCVLHISYIAGGFFTTEAPGEIFSIEHMITPNLLLHSFSIYIVTWLKNLKIILDFFPL